MLTPIYRGVGRHPGFGLDRPMPAPESVFLSTMDAGPLSWSPDDVQKSQIKQHSSQLLGPKPPWRVGGTTSAP